MKRIEAINNDADLDSALERIGELLRYPEDTPESEELDVLSDLVIAYEAIHYPIPAPTLTEAIKCRLEDLSLNKYDLIPLIGSREAVDKVLTGEMTITSKMAQGLHRLLGIDLELLLGEATSRQG